MKKTVLILLALTMCVLPLCSCEAELTEKQQEKIDLYEKYEDLIEALEDEDYDDVMKEIEDIFSEEDDDGEDGDTDRNDGGDIMDTETAEDPSDKYAWTADIIPGTWTYYDYDTESNIAFTVREDGTCEIFGTSYEWTLGNVRDYEDPITYFEINITDGDAVPYQVYYRYDSDNERWYTYLYGYDHENGYYASVSNSAYDVDEMTVVELTVDNWYDYFEYTETITPSFNAFNELSDVSYSQRFTMKSEYADRYYSTLSSYAMEYSYIYGGYYVSVDTSTYDITVNEVGYVNYERSSSISSGFSTDYLDDDSRGYYVYINSSYISDFDNGYCSIYTDIMIDRVVATLYFFN